MKTKLLTVAFANMLIVMACVLVAWMGGPAATSAVHHVLSSLLVGSVTLGASALLVLDATA